MANHKIKMDGLSIKDSVSVGGTTSEPMENPPTGIFSNHASYFGTFEIQNYIPENAEIVEVRANTGFERTYMTDHCDYTESGYNCFFYPRGYYLEYGPFNATTLAQWLAMFGHSQSIYYRVGVKISSSYWTRIEGGYWRMNEKIKFSFYPWIEITYKDSEVLTKIKISLTEPTLGTQHWQRVSTYTAVDTPEGLKWAECEVRYCIDPAIWVDIPNATAEEQPRTDGYEAVGADVPNKILNGYCGNSATTWNRVRGSDTRRTLTYHDAPPGTYKIRFSCAYSFRLYRANYDSTWHDLQISYQAGTYDYEITTTTTGFVGFMFIFNSTSEAQTFEMAKLDESGEPTWVLCGEEA